MPQFTHNNHLKFGWGDGLYNFDDKNEKFWLEPGTVEYIPTSFKDECVRSAKLIGAAADKPILLGFSGGVDSEIAARSFIEADVPFEIVFKNVVYNGNIINSHDTMYAKSFIKKYNIKSHTIDLDFKKLVDRFTRIRESNNTAEPYYKTNISPLGVVTMFESFCNDYVCVKGAGELFLSTYRRFNEPEPVQYGIYATGNMAQEISSYEMSHRNSANIINFFCYTPETWLAWLLHPDVQHWIKYEKALMGPYTWMNNYSLKAFIVYKIWPDMEIRPKFNGFEYVPEYNELFNDTFYHDNTVLTKIPIEDLTNMLLRGSNRKRKL